MVNDKEQIESYILSELSNYGHTKKWHSNSHFPGYSFSDGLQFLVQQAKSDVVLDYIFSHSRDLDYKENSFQIWRIYFQENGSAIATVTDYKEQVLKTFKIAKIEFPLRHLEVWLIGKFLRLPNEC